MIAGIDQSAAGHPPPDSASEAVLTNLRRWSVQTVIVGPMPGQVQVVAWFSQIFRRRPTWYGSVALWKLRPDQGLSQVEPVALRSSPQDHIR